MSDKQYLIQVLQSLPDGASIEAIRDEVELSLAILEGQRDIDEGRTHTHEEVMEMAKQCLSKYVGPGLPEFDD